MHHPKHQGLLPFGQAQCLADLEALWGNEEHQATLAFQANLLETATSDAFEVPGFCLCCDLETRFLVDLEWGGYKEGEQLRPNWRERMVCPSCQMNNRQRLIATLLKQSLQGKAQQFIYLMEQVTPIFGWAQHHCAGHTLTGSEYLRPGCSSGSVIQGIRHEDIENMSFASGSLDLIVSNDVFEHVPNYLNALAECSRVLKPGGTLLATIPFHSNSPSSVVRAQLKDGNIEHLLPAQYHGNPVSQEGSLVFTDFGWDLLSAVQDQGFQHAAIDYYASIPFGHLGGGMGVFVLTK
jgi:hypothetical protein